MRLLLLAAFACSPQSSDDPEERGDNPTLVIVSPEDGERFAQGDPVPLEVEARAGDLAVTITRATWTIGEWSASGAEASARGIGVGEWIAEVEAIVDGRTLTASRDFQVLPGEGDADTDADSDADTDADTDADPMNYSGSFDAEVEYSEYSGFVFDCPGSLSFVLAGSGFSGSGLCQIEIDDTYDVPFTIEGVVSGSSISGDLVMTTDGSDYRTPFTGTGRSGEAFTANFDETHRSGDGDLRIWGSWTANPQ